MKRPAFPWRGLILGLLIEIPTVFWVAASEITARVFISSWSLTMTAVLALLALIAINEFVAPRWPRLALSRTDMLVVFVMLSSTSVIYGYGLIQVLIPSLGGAHWWADEVNNWQALLWPLLPDWAVVPYLEELRGLFEGYSTPTWQIWLPRLLAFGSFLLCAYAASLGLALLLSRQWIASERLTFPIVALPLEMTQPQWPVLRSRLMWIGFLLPAVLETLLALQFWFPVVPAVTMKHQQHPEWFGERPWGVLKPLYFGWTPFIVGLAYFAPTEISFSIWFFVLFNMALRVFGVMVGWTDPSAGRASPDFPFLVETTVGGFLAFGAISVYMAKDHFWRTMRLAAGRAAPSEDPGFEQRDDSELGDRPAPVYRRAYLLLIGGSLGLIVFGLQLGMDPLPIIGLFTLYFLVVITLARLRAEAGPAWAFGPDRDPNDLMVWLFGSRAFNRQTLVGVGLLTFFFADVRFATLPSYLESLKVGYEIRLPRRHLIAIIAIATVVAIGFGLFAATTLFYDLGAATAKTYGSGRGVSRASFNLPMQWLTMPTGPDWQRLPWVFVGGVTTLVLHLVRLQVLWWPFHPVGYVMANTGAGHSFWLHYLIAWAAKTAILRAGGMKLYRQSLPFVVGVILGDITAQTVWSLVASIMGWPVYQFVS